MSYDKDKKVEYKELIIEGISNGKSLKSILDNNKDLPTRTIVYKWLDDEDDYYDKTFLNNYVRAREASADLDAEILQEIAEKTLRGEYEPAAARAASQNYIWNAGKKQPKKYGDKLDMTSGNKPFSFPILNNDPLDKGNDSVKKD